MFAVVLPIVGFVYLRCLSHNAAKDHIAENRDDLPTMAKLLLSFLIGKKESAKQLIHENNTADKSKELLSIVVKVFAYTAEEIQRFKKLCGNSKIALYHIFPHTIAQRCILSITSNQHFPISLIGALHLKSFFELHNIKLMESFVSHQDSSSSKDFSLVVKYWGMVPNPKKGTDIVITLELFHNPTETLVWTEVFVLYTHQTVPNYPPNPTAEAILTNCSKHYDFSNLLKDEITLVDSPVLPTAGDTWEFGLLSNDINPIHMSSWVARLLGHRSRIAHGVMVLGKVFSVLERAVVYDDDDTTVVPMRWAVSLKGPIACNDPVNIYYNHSSPPHLHQHHHVDLYASKSTRPNMCVRMCK